MPFLHRSKVPIISRCHKDKHFNVYNRKYKEFQKTVCESLTAIDILRATINNEINSEISLSVRLITEIPEFQKILNMSAGASTESYNAISIRKVS